MIVPLFSRSRCFVAMVDQPQVDDLLEIRPAALNSQQLLVAQRDVLAG